MGCGGNCGCGGTCGGKKEPVLAAGNPDALREWFNNGADGQINWGEHGDFDACVELASKHMDEDQAKGFCNMRHQDVTGGAPGHAPSEMKASGELELSVIEDRLVGLERLVVNLAAARLPEVLVAAGSEDLVNELRVLLADTVAFYLKASSAHWNVIGNDFQEYHALFAAIYEDAADAIDPIAENIRKLGGQVPLDTAGLVADQAGAPGVDPRTLAADLMVMNANLIAKIQNAFDTATMIRSQGIANFLADRQDMHEKWQWQLKASLGVIA